jgi:serine/threonine protein kinase
VSPSVLTNLLALQNRQGPIMTSWPLSGTVITTSSGAWYRVGRQIASGAYALVFEGTNSFGHLLALKVFKPANRPYQEVKAQWEKECRLFQRLQHPHVVAIYDAFIHENLFYIVLERAIGNVADWIGFRGSLSDTAVIEVAAQLLDGLYFVHANGVLHRDLTIFNTLVFQPIGSSSAVLKISDFGISKEFIDPWDPMIGMTQVAHPLFMLPELLLPQYGYTTVQSDLYHLGLILLYALTGHLPVDGSMTVEQAKGAVIQGVPRQQAEMLGTPLGNYISVLLRRHREYRFQTVIDAWNGLQQFI